MIYVDHSLGGTCRSENYDEESDARFRYRRKTEKNFREEKTEIMNFKINYLYIYSFLKILFKE